MRLWLARSLTGALLILLTTLGLPPTTAGASDDPTAVNRLCGTAVDAGISRVTGTEDDFFPRQLSTVYLHGSRHPAELPRILTEVEVLFAQRYGDDTVDVTVVDRPETVTPVAGERTIIIDDSLGVPGEPRLYTGERATSLYVHPGSVVADIAPLLPSPCLPAGAGTAARWLLGDDEPQVLTGYEDDADFSVHLPRGWQVIGEATFETQVVATEIGRGDTSLRVDIEDRPARTWSLDDETEVSMTLGPEMFVDGGFDLTASTTTPIIDDNLCRDVDHVGRWVDIGQPTVDATIVPAELDVARAVASFGPISQLTAQPVTITVAGDRSSPEILEAIGGIVAAIGQHGAPIAWELAEPGEGSRALVVDLLPVEDGAPKATVLIDDGVPTLQLWGDPSELARMTRAMALPDRLLYFHATEVPFTSVPPVERWDGQEVFVFEDAGYDDRTLRGSGDKALVYKLHIPAGVPPDRATLALYGTYSPLLAQVDATISVRVNGSEEQIVAVADTSGRLEELHTITPANLRPGLNFVKISVDMGPEVDSCYSASPEGWITISRTSALAAALESEPQPPDLGVEDARFALAATADFVEADVVIPNRQTDVELLQALRIIGELADRGEGGSPRLVVDADASTENHLVVVGAPDGRELLEGVLPVDVNSAVGIVGALPSPHRDGRLLLTMTGGSPEATNRAIEAALSSDVNDITDPFALVGIDSVESIGDGVLSTIGEPEQLAYEDRAPGPGTEDYDSWIVAQAQRIEAAKAPETEARRTAAFGLLLLGAVLAGLGWIRKVRIDNAAGAGGSSGH